MQEMKRRSFLAAILSTGAALAATGAVVKIAKASPVVPAEGPLLVVFDAAKSSTRNNDAYYPEVMEAVHKIANGRTFFQVCGQQIFPVYSRDGHPTTRASLILVPEDYEYTGTSDFPAVRLRWLGGDQFERIA